MPVITIIEIGSNLLVPLPSIVLAGKLNNQQFFVPKQNSVFFWCNLIDKFIYIFLYFVRLCVIRLTATNGELTITKSHGLHPPTSQSSSSTNSNPLSQSSHHHQQHLHPHLSHSIPPMKLSPSSMHLSPSGTDNSNNDLLDDSPSKSIWKMFNS